MDVVVGVVEETGQLVSPELSKLMKSILADPAHEHKFVKGLKEVQPESEIFRKSGTWRHFHSDSALIQHQGRVYAVTAIAETKNGESMLRDIIRVVDDIIMEGNHRRGRRSRRVGRR